MSKESHPEKNMQKFSNLTFPKLCCRLIQQTAFTYTLPVKSTLPLIKCPYSFPVFLHSKSGQSHKKEHILLFKDQCKKPKSTKQNKNFPIF